MNTTAPVVDCTTLRARLNGAVPPRLLDVRTPAEFESAHIAGSYNVPLDLLREHRGEIVERLDEDVVLVCRSGQRAAAAEQALRNSGIPNLHVLDGGIAAWQANGYEVERGIPRWDLERQVRLVAGSLVLASILGSIAVPKLKWLAAGLGGGLTVAAVTNSCLMGTLLAKLPYNRTSSCDARTMVEQLAGPAAPLERAGRP